MTSKGIFLFSQHRKLFELMTDEDVKSTVVAALRHNEGLDPGQLSYGAEIACTFLFDQIDRFNDSYDRRCRTNAEIAKKRELKKRASAGDTDAADMLAADAFPDDDDCEHSDEIDTVIAIASEEPSQKPKTSARKSRRTASPAPAKDADAHAHDPAADEADSTPHETDADVSVNDTCAHESSTKTHEARTKSHLPKQKENQNTKQNKHTLSEQNQNQNQNHPSDTPAQTSADNVQTAEKFTNVISVIGRETDEKPQSDATVCAVAPDRTENEQIPGDWMGLDDKRKNDNLTEDGMDDWMNDRIDDRMVDSINNRMDDGLIDGMEDGEKKEELIDFGFEHSTDAVTDDTPVPPPITSPAPPPVTRPTCSNIPTREELYAYCAQHAPTVDADAFYDYYEKRNWTIGDAPVISWKGLVNTWQVRSSVSTARKSAAPTPAAPPAVQRHEEPRASYDLDEFLAASMRHSFDSFD